MKTFHKIPAFGHLTAAFAVFLMLAPGQAGAGDEHGLYSMKALEQLDLSDEQRAKLKAIREAAKTDREADWSAIRELRSDLREKLASDASDDELRKMYTTLEEKRSEKHTRKFERMLEVRSVLTKEQRQKLIELGKDRKHKKGDCRKDKDGKDGN